MKKTITFNRYAIFTIGFVTLGICYGLFTLGITSTMDFTEEMGVSGYIVPMVLFSIHLGVRMSGIKTNPKRIVRDTMYPFILATYIFSPDYFIPLLVAYVVYTATESMEALFSKDFSEKFNSMMGN